MKNKKQKVNKNTKKEKKKEKTAKNEKTEGQILWATFMHVNDPQWLEIF